MSDPTTTIVIFGASGDLTQRKLVPALYTLFHRRRLPEKFQVVGFSRSEMDSAQFRARMREGAQEHAREDVTDDGWEAFAPHLHYFSGDPAQASGFKRLQEALATVEDGPANRLYYFSTPPELFVPLADQLDDNAMLKEDGGWRRVVVEKPFGHDLQSARTLNTELHEDLREDQIYRIDHYLAKETVQNILVFRFGNTIFEPIWNRNYIESVQITAAESVDVGHRAGYYEKSGVLRDMFQNHLLQLLTMVAMEPPASFAADAIRNEKSKVLSSIRPIVDGNAASETVRGQYAGYRDAEGVAEKSLTATYAALRLYIDNWRWQGVPFYLRSGKALKQKATEITIQFKCPPHNMFSHARDFAMRSNVLSICIQPDEGMHLQMEAKVPDTDADMRPVSLEFHYADTFGVDAIPEAYERLLLEALEGDASLFTRGDNIELAWSIIDPILEAWQTDEHVPLEIYERGTWGPKAADDLLAASGHVWLLGCGSHEDGVPIVHATTHQPG